MSYQKTDFPRISQADIAFSKLSYSLRKFKNEKKKADVSKFSTLREAVESNMNTFETKKAKMQKNALNGSKNAVETLKDIEEKEIQYLLDIIPFVTEYGKKEEIDKDDTESSSLFHVASKNTNNNTFMKYLFHVEKVENAETLHAVTERETVDEINTCKCGGRYIAHISSTESHMVCELCGSMTPLIETYSVTEQNEGAVYKRINHLAECLNALQGKEGTNVPQDVIDAIKAEFKKNRISMTAEIKPEKVKQYLKKLGYSKYYENIHTIAYNISGMPSLELSKELEKKFKDMFVEIQEPFYRHKNEKRKNFLSYNYVLYKFSELLGEDDLLRYFPLLKCSKNLHAHDIIWKKICQDLSWEFIPTV